MIVWPPASSRGQRYAGGRPDGEGDGRAEVGLPSTSNSTVPGGVGRRGRYVLTGR